MILDFEQKFFNDTDNKRQAYSIEIRATNYEHRTEKKYFSFYKDREELYYQFIDYCIGLMTYKNTACSCYSVFTFHD